MYLESARRLVQRIGRAQGLLEIFSYLYGDLSKREKELLTAEGLLVNGKPNVDVVYSVA